MSKCFDIWKSIFFKRRINDIILIVVQRIHPIMITTQQTGNERELIPMKILQICLVLNTFSKIRNKARMHPPTTSFQQSTKRKGNINVGKEKINLMIHQWYDRGHRKSQGVCKTIIRTMQRCRLQGRCTEIIIFLHFSNKFLEIKL